MNTTPPRVTVIIPTYNWSSVLPYSVGSALRQTFEEFEVLVVGDGCTDDSERVVNAFDDARVRWINLPSNNGHQSAPNNEGLRQARGEFIAYLGHDDLWLPHHLACLVAALDAGADLAYAVTLRVFPGGTLKEYAPEKRVYVPGDWLPPTGLAHRRGVTESVGGWADYRALKVSPETDLWRRACERGFKFVFVPRLTAVKFPASKRPGIYRETPHHEQAEWFERIRREGDLEASELARLLLAKSSDDPTWEETLYPEMTREFLSQTWKRIRRRLLFAIGRPPPAPREGEQIEADRLRKGLRPKL